MLLKPVHDRIIVQKDEPEKVSKGGIVIPDAAQERATRGVILAVGPGKYAEKTGVFIPTTLTVGTKVLFHPYAGSEMKVGDLTFYNMPEGDIWAIVEDDEESADTSSD
jgi:chaperonin GroES